MHPDIFQLRMQITCLRTLQVCDTLTLFVTLNVVIVTHYNVTCDGDCVSM